MVENKKKNLSEFAVSLCTARWLLTSASQLMSGGVMGQEEKEISDSCHIYVITKIPSVSFDKETFSYDEGFISGNLNYQVDGKVRQIPFKSELLLLDGATKIELSRYPHRKINTLDETGNVVRHLDASTIAIAYGAHIDNSELGNLEVLYVGQAYGDGGRTAIERLKSHSTLQKILADIQYNLPEYEAHVLTFEYLPYRVITHMDGHIESEDQGEHDSDRLISILDNPLSEKQQVCLAEAGLIRYFSPKYNKIYKDSFPSNSHQILESCYDLDFSALVVEINTEELRYLLFSETIEASHHHIAKFDLVSHENRWGFFHFSSNDGGVKMFPGVIESR